jgi:hypothetical protein
MVHAKSAVIEVAAQVALATAIGLSVSVVLAGGVLLLAA